MKSSRVVALAGAVVAIGCALLLAEMARGSPARAPAAPSAEPEAPAGPSGSATSERPGSAVARARTAGPEVGPQDRPPAEEDREPARELTRAEKQAADRQLHAAHIAHVKDAYEREPADPAWSASTTSRVWETIRQTDFVRDAARSVECRSRSCRVEVDDDGTGILHKHLPVFGQQFADVLPVMVGEPVRDEDGRGRMVLYLMEADQQPPAAEVD
jgi:hypothetical protein